MNYAETEGGVLRASNVWKKEHLAGPSLVRQIVQS